MGFWQALLTFGLVAAGYLVPVIVRSRRGWIVTAIAGVAAIVGLLALFLFVLPRSLFNAYMAVFVLQVGLGFVAGLGVMAFIVWRSVTGGMRSALYVAGFVLLALVLDLSGLLN